MKAIVVAAIAVLFVVSLRAQGTIRLDNNIAGKVVTHIYEAPAGDPTFAQVGNGPNDFPAGTVNWSRHAPLASEEYAAQLWAAPTQAGVLQPESSLLPAFPVTGFRPKNEAGFVQSTIATLNGVPADAPFATVQLRAWITGGGSVTNWDQAVEWNALRGASPVFNVSNIGGANNPPPVLEGLVSFSLSMTPSIPEPSLSALLGVGATVALAASRRKKQRGS